jgi:fatty-acyl-CoA synthase
VFLPRETGIAGWLPAWAEIQPDRPLITFEDQHLSWSEFDGRVQRLAAGLRQLGVVKGDRIGCLMHNRPEFLELFWATVRLGAIFVPLNVRLAVPELQYVIGDVGPKAVACDDRFAAQVEALQELTTVPEWLHADDRWPRADARGLPGALPVWGDPAAILYTSGTTGRPKGAVISHGNIHSQSVNWITSFGLTRYDRQLMFLPLCFTGGIISASMNTFLAGGSMLLAAGFDPAALLRAIERERTTWFTAVPTMVQRLLEHPDAPGTDLSSLKMVESGGSPVPGPLIERARSLGLELIQGYGLTEGTGGVNLYLQEWEGVRKPGSCGKAPVLGGAKVVRDDGTECEPGEIGELLISGPLVFQGYWRDPSPTAETIVDGWLHTGDLARRDEEGFFYLAGRKKEMIITGGLNVYPVEVESVMVRADAVADVAVIGLPDDRWGETVTAYVVARPGTEVDLVALLAYCREQLADYKVPKAVHVVEALPRTASGKVLKRVLVEQAREPRGMAV